jgi:endogenous inhibitor of DNA gyrase (YacG/DUF329 family)
MEGKNLTRQCRRCGSPIPLARTATKAIYCSFACKVEADHLHRKEVRKSKRPVRHCKQCGREVPRDKISRAVFCTNKCGYDWKNRERYYSDPAAHKEKTTRWREKNRERVCIYTTKLSAARRAKQRSAVPAWLDRADLFWVEYYHRAAKDLGLTVDHIVPIKGRDRSGLHVWWNMQLLSRSRNAAKGNRA